MLPMVVARSSPVKGAKSAIYNCLVDVMYLFYSYVNWFLFADVIGFYNLLSNRN